MGENISFTKEQKFIIDKISKEPNLSSKFYFTGGTALSCFYLHHRYSEDLDFFTEHKFDHEVVKSIISRWAKDENFTFKAIWKEVVYIFILTFPNGINLKLDFGYYPYKRVEKGKDFEGVTVDSLLDIAINKLTTINQRIAVKDFVDLYFLFQEFTIWDLIEGMRVKFNIKTEPFLLAGDFLKVEEFEIMPRMIKPLTLDELKIFYRQKTQELAMRGVE
jgi:predicted nucleotidyltransferase component of viral defense system